MEESFGRNWVVLTSSLISCVVVAITVGFSVFKDWTWYPMLLAGLIFTVPGLMRFFICREWKPVEVQIKNSSDLSRPFISSRGVSMANAYEADIEYYVEEEVFRAKMRSTFPFKRNKIIIFYDPSAPSVFTQNKGPGWYGLGFAVLVAFSLFKIVQQR